MRWTVVACAGSYLLGLWLDGVGSSLPERTLPRPLLFFLQAASLFTQAGSNSIDYRAEAWLCSPGRWVEMDTRPYFEINQDDKENRFHRTLHFYRQNRPTLQALEAYLIESHASGKADDGVPRGARVGGMRFSSLRRPIPELGQHAARWQRHSLSDVPEDMRRRWYWTRRSKRTERCGEAPPPEADE